MLQAIYDAMDPVAFAIGSLQIRWYGLAYLAGFIICSLVAYSISKRWKMNITPEDMMVVIIAIMLGTIIGGRVGYVLFYGNGYYLANPGQILNLQAGGMSFHGGLVGVVIAGIIASKIIHVRASALADIIAIAAPIGLFFGRCANFINGELWGAVTDLPWGVVFDTAGAGSLPRHPSQLYEAILEGVVIFVVLYLLSKKRNPLPSGSYMALFLIMYGTFRILIEFVRQPDAQIGYLYGDWLTMGMVLSVPLIVAGVVLLIWARKTGYNQYNQYGETKK